MRIPQGRKLSLNETAPKLGLGETLGIRRLLDHLKLLSQSTSCKTERILSVWLESGRVGHERQHSRALTAEGGQIVHCGFNWYRADCCLLNCRIDFGPLGPRSPSQRKQTIKLI